MTPAVRLAALEREAASMRVVLARMLARERDDADATDLRILAGWVETVPATGRRLMDTMTAKAGR
jgi:hypothetical protein